VNAALSPVHTVAEKYDRRRFVAVFGVSRRFLRQSHFSATVWTGLYLRRSLMPEAVFPLRLRVALRGERNRNTIGVSISLATQRNAQP